MLYVVEQATGHWGVGPRYFGPPFLDGVHPALLVAAYAVPMLLATHLGILFGTVYLRWGTAGVVGSLGLAIVGAGLLAAAITWTRQWREIGGWLLDQPATALVAA